MKWLRISALVFVISFTSCISWVLAKSAFNDMPSGEYSVDLTHASIVWKVSHFGLSNYVGRFADFDANISFDAKDIENSRVAVSINPMSIQTAYPKADEKDFDNILATEKGWFNAKQFPSIDFTSTSIEMTSESTAIMRGNLTFLGTSKEVILDVILNGAMTMQPLNRKPTMGFSATTSLLRSEFGMRKYLPSVGDKVEVMIEGEFIHSSE